MISYRFRKHLHRYVFADAGLLGCAPILVSQTPPFSSSDLVRQTPPFLVSQTRSLPLIESPDKKRDKLPLLAPAAAALSACKYPHVSQTGGEYRQRFKGCELGVSICYCLLAGFALRANRVDLCMLVCIHSSWSHDIDSCELCFSS